MKPIGERWTDEEDEELKRRWADGETSSQIREGMRLYSRNQVIGRLHRLGVTRGDRLMRTSPRPRTEPDRQPSPRVRQKVHPLLGYWTSGKTHQQPPQPVRDGLPTSLEMRCVSFMELTADNCHWPIGDPRDIGFAFCGLPAPGEGPYCPVHRQLAYNYVGPVNTWKLPKS